MKTKLVSLAMLVMVLISSSYFTAFAQPPNLDDDPGVPIDGGASLLVGAAVVYGAKKIKDRKNAKNSNL